jgi:hypothetical protein
MTGSLTRVIELIFRVQVLCGEAHLLQCDLDRRGSRLVVFGKVICANRVFIADGPKWGSQLHERVHWDLHGGSAEGSWSITASIFSPIQNRVFSKT